MALNIEKELAALQRLSAKDLQGRYAEVYGEPTRSHHKQWLAKRIIWRMQANGCCPDGSGKLAWWLRWVEGLG